MWLTNPTSFANSNPKDGTDNNLKDIHHATTSSSSKNTPLTNALLSHGHGTQVDIILIGMSRTGTPNALIRRIITSLIDPR
jgi:hypothetical protein